MDKMTPSELELFNQCNGKHKTLAELFECKSCSLLFDTDKIAEKKILKYYTKSVYGNPLHYLVDCPEADAILALIGQRTISKSQMGLFSQLGLTFTEVLPIYK